MIEELPVLNTLGAVLTYSAKFIILIAAGIALHKNKNTTSLFLCISSLLIIVGDILSFVLIVTVGLNGTEEIIQINGINAMLSGFTYTLFAISLLLFILKSIKSSIGNSKEIF